jgi:hypothetical protein
MKKNCIVQPRLVFSLSGLAVGRGVKIEEETKIHSNTHEKSKMIQEEVEQLLIDIIKKKFRVCLQNKSSS